MQFTFSTRCFSFDQSSSILCHFPFIFMPLQISFLQTRRFGSGKTPRQNHGTVQIKPSYLRCVWINAKVLWQYRVVQKTGYPVLIWDNFGNSAPILTIRSLLQAEIYGAWTWSSSTHHTFIVWPHYLAKRTLLLISVLGVYISVATSCCRSEYLVWGRQGWSSLILELTAYTAAKSSSRRVCCLTSEQYVVITGGHCSRMERQRTSPGPRWTIWKKST